MLQSILSSPKSDANTLGGIAFAIGNSKTPIEGGAQILQSILSSPKSDANTRAEVEKSIVKLARTK